MAGDEKVRQFYHWSFVHLLIYCLGITVTNEAYSVITNVEITISLENFQVTDGNSRILNRIQMVTDG
jgi:hypothetical protein